MKIFLMCQEQNLFICIFLVIWAYDLSASFCSELTVVMNSYNWNYALGSLHESPQLFSLALLDQPERTGKSPLKNYEKPVNSKTFLLNQLINDCFVSFTSHQLLSFTVLFVSMRGKKKNKNSSLTKQSLNI